jgi:hypothetical protein
MIDWKDKDSANRPQRGREASPNPARLSGVSAHSPDHDRALGVASGLRVGGKGA